MLPMIWSYEANVDEEDSDDSSEEWSRSEGESSWILVHQISS
jgi:hypothetical protein